MLSPRDVIADIRRSFRVDGPARDDDPYREMASSLLPLVTDELYESRTHFFRELLQNADDNLYAKGVVPTLELTASPTSIVLANNETGFEEKHVRALCNAAKSTKKDRKEGATGEKGIGFKAVFQVSDRPEIHSNGYHFCFDRIKYGSFGMIIPEWIECETQNAGTSIILPLRKDYRLPPDFLKSLQPELLLFLRRLKRIEFRDVDYGQAAVLHRRDDGPIVEVVRTVTDDVEKQRSGEQRHSFRVQHKRVSVADLQEGRRPNIEATDVAIALALDADGDVDEGRARDLFAFLPVKDSGFRFVAHADFVLATSREAVREDLPWNIRLRDSLGDCLAEAILGCRSTSPPGATALRVLTDPKSVLDPFLRDVLVRAIKLLGNEECVPTIGGNWIRPSHAIITDGDGLWELVSETDAATLLTKTYVNPGVDGIGQALGRLGVSRFTLDTLLTCIGNEAWRKGRAADWFGALYGRLGGTRLSEGQVDTLRKAPILLLEKGQTTTPAAGDVFRSLGSDVRYGFETDLALLAPNVLTSISKDQHKGAHDLLQRLGVFEATPTAVIDRHILPRHGGEDWKSCPDDVLIGHAHYIRDYWRAYLDAKPQEKKEAAKRDLGAKLKVLTSTTTKESRHGLAQRLYLGRAYRDHNDLEGLFGEAITSVRVSPEYLSRGHAEGAEASAKAWGELFLALGAETLPRVSYNADKSDFQWAAEAAALIQSGETVAKQRFLSLIDKHWDSKYSSLKARPNGAPPGPSKLLLALQAMEVPTTIGASAIGKGYRLSEENRAVFGDAVPYLTTTLSDSTSDALGVTRAPTIAHALARLEEVRQTVSDLLLARLSVGPLYKFLDLRFEQHAAEITAAFSTRKLILADTADGGTWATTKDCCWTLPRELRQVCPIAGLSLVWRDLQGFFCEKLGVADSLSPDSLVDALVALVKASLRPDQTTLIARVIYGRLRNAASEIDEHAADAAVWLQRLRGERLIWTKGNAWCRNDDDVFAADDQRIEALFQPAAGVAFIHLPPEELTSHADLLRLLGIQTLSDAITTHLPDDISSDAWPEFMQGIGERMRAIARFLHHKHLRVFGAAVASGAFSSLSALDAHRCTPLELEVALNKARARHPFEARLIKDHGRHSLFVNASADSPWEAIGIEIGRLLGLADTESLPIGTLLEKRTLADVERFLETLRVAQLPPDVAKALFDEGEDASQAPPDEDGSHVSAAAIDADTEPGASGVLGAQGESDKDDGDQSREEGDSPVGNQSDTAGSPPGAPTGNDKADHKSTIEDAAGETPVQGSNADNVTRHNGTTPVDDHADSTDQNQSDAGSRGPAADSGADDEDGISDGDTTLDESGISDGRDTGAAGHSSSGSGARGGRDAGDGRSRADGKGSDGRPPTKPDASGRSRPSRSKSGFTNEQLRSYVSKDHEPDDDGEDGVSKEETAQISAAAIRIVLEWERQQKRVPIDENVVNPNNEGYDIASRGPNGDLERYIEVKGVKAKWGLRGVAVTPPQFRFAEAQGHRAWLYVVEFALSDAPRIHRLQDFARRVSRFGVDDGWRDIAESANETQWPEAVTGMRVRLPDGRTGSVKRVYGAGHNQGVDIVIDKGDEVIRVPWQPARIGRLLDEEKN